MTDAAGLPPLSAYVHLPWCIRKCPYCDFNSHEAGGELPETDYLAALRRDLEAQTQMVASRPLRSVFFGGGTPSLISAATVDAILRALEEAFGFEPGIEITLEANPGASDARRFTGYREAGVNRLSIGAQSFDDAQLRRLGRIHAAHEINDAFAAARSAGFDNINLDLMHGLPAQRPAGAEGDLTLALALEPTHLSWYQLTIEPNTGFHKRPPALPNDDVLADIEDAGFAMLAAAGYARYEISAFARAGYECRHNLNYWRFGDYLGLGAGAHGKHTLADGTLFRTTNTRLPRDYLNAVTPTRTTDVEEDFFEFMLNALRLTTGFSPQLFTARTGRDAADLDGFTTAAIGRGLLEAVQSDDGVERYQPTGPGLRFLNDLQLLAADHVPAPPQTP